MGATANEDTPGNAQEIALAMARAAREYAENAPAWNFVQGNLIAENSFLRRAVVVSVAVGALVALALVAGIYGIARTGGVRVWAVPVDSHGAVVARATTLTMDASPTTGEIISRVKQVTEALFSASVQPSVNRARETFALGFLTTGTHQTIVAYRQADAADRDPAAIARSGRFVDVNVLHIIPTGGGAYEVAWQETTSDLSGRVVGRRNSSAIYSVAVDPHAATPDNPYGVYVTSLHFATAFGGQS